METRKANAEGKRTCMDVKMENMEIGAVYEVVSGPHTGHFVKRFDSQLRGYVIDLTSDYFKPTWT